MPQTIITYHEDYLAPGDTLDLPGDEFDVRLLDVSLIGTELRWRYATVAVEYSEEERRQQEEQVRKWLEEDEE